MHHKKKSGGFPLFWMFVIAVFVSAAALAALFFSAGLLDVPKKKGVTPEPVRETETYLVAEDKTSVMIMGVDEREGDVGRSDTLMVAFIDPKKDQASLLSIPRDSRVRIPRFGYDKINAAYAHGGYTLTKRTVEEFLDTRVDHHVLVKVPAFKRIIDAIGGIELDVEKRMYYVDEWDDDGGLYIDLYPGYQHLDGKDAIGYVRYRDEEGDIGRVRRQQNFMRAVMEKVTSPSIIPRLPDIIREVMGSVDTDLSFREILALAGSLREAQKNGLTAKMVAGRGLYIDGIAYWIPDIRDARESVAGMLGIDISRGARDEIDREASEYEASVPSDASEEYTPPRRRTETYERSYTPREERARSPGRTPDAISPRQKESGRESHRTDAKRPTQAPRVAPSVGTPSKGSEKPQAPAPRTTPERVTTPEPPASSRSESHPTPPKSQPAPLSPAAPTQGGKGA